jgi:hypothetical protein
MTSLLARFGVDDIVGKPNRTHSRNPSGHLP